MIEALYENIGERKEVDSVMDFHAFFVKDDEQEASFFKAIRDSRLAGFKEGMKAALEILAEVH